MLGEHLFAFPSWGPSEGFTACVNCGYCCRKAPCPFGTQTPCEHLVELDDGRGICGDAARIAGEPGADMCPAFGAGCCCALNSYRLRFVPREG